MEFFLDTGNIEEIKEASTWGLINGVTTNPSLIAKTGKKQEEVIPLICNIIDGPISAEVLSEDAAGMISEATELVKIHKNVVIKIPMTVEGIKALKTLSEKKIKTNLTLVFSSNQALLAAKNGATYVSPFLGRLDDIGHDGMNLIEEIRTIYRNYNFDTKIIAASLRNPTHVRDCALYGADVATMPMKVAKSLFDHPLTNNGIKKFLSDYQSTSTHS